VLLMLRFNNRHNWRTTRHCQQGARLQMTVCCGCTSRTAQLRLLHLSAVCRLQWGPLLALFLARTFLKITILKRWPRSEKQQCRQHSVLCCCWPPPHPHLSPPEGHTPHITVSTISTVPASSTDVHDDASACSTSDAAFLHAACFSLPAFATMRTCRPRLQVQLKLLAVQFLQPACCTSDYDFWHLPHLQLAGLWALRSNGS
jgi:hypothetical protein